MEEGKGEAPPPYRKLSEIIDISAWAGQRGPGGIKAIPSL
jgi:hypothetical protein